MTAPEYRIETVADFAKVPADRLGDCLAEFVPFLFFTRHAGEADPEVGLALEAFTWIDDGVEGVRGVNLRSGDREEYLPNPNFPPPEARP